MKLKSSLSLFLACALGFARPLAAAEPQAPPITEPQAPPAEPQAPPAPEPQTPAVEEPQTPPPAKPSLAGRRTLHRFVLNYGRDLVGVISKDTLKPLLVAAGATGTAAFFDDNAQSYFTPGRRARWLGDSGETLGKPIVIVPMALALFAAGRLQSHQGFRDGTYDILEVTAVTASYATLLKYTVRRERPDGSNKLSFPSGHASNAFAWATVGAHYYGWKLAIPGYTLASLVAISRLEKNVHHLSDVVAGAGLGYISARSVLRKNSDPLSPAPTAQLTFAPLTDPHGQGVGLQALLAF
jgi:PAP2 superfamily